MPAKRRVLVCFEGEVTERLYVNGLRKLLRSHPVQIETGGACGEPLKVVRSAISRMKKVRSGDVYDEVWCLFDVETPPHGGLDSAIALAQAKNINCAISNPCFELWLVLHVDSCNRYMTTGQMIELAESMIPSYGDKKFSFEDLEESIDTASMRAMALDNKYEKHEGPQQKNPSTSMWRFIDSLQCFKGVKSDSQP